jgi:hypothetical protein
MMELLIAITECDWSRGTSCGAGAIIVVERPMVCRDRCVVGGGAMIVLDRPGVARVRSRRTSGGGASSASFDKVGAVREDLSPSAGGGPRFDLKASRFATGALEMGSLRLGASTTFSVAALPRATRIAWLR